jgi:uncharacterized protein YjbI with pentapeptide repeats
LSRKHRRPSALQPPQFSTTVPLAAQTVALLETCATYTEQAWIDQHFDSQSAEDVCFERLDVRGGSFHDAALRLLQATDCRFDTTDFANCALEKAYLRRIEFLGCRLIGIKIGDADLEDIRFSRCNARLLRCWASSCKSIRFDQCALQEASFDGSNLAGAVFYKCDLIGADFRNTNLEGADLRGSTLAGIQIQSKDLKGAIIDPAQALELVQLLGVIVRPEDQAPELPVSGRP